MTPKQKRWAKEVAAAMLLLSRRTAAALLATADALYERGSGVSIAATVTASERVLLKSKSKARAISENPKARTRVDEDLLPAKDSTLARAAAASIGARLLELEAEHEVREDVLEALEPRIGTIATTESWRALNDETARAARSNGEGSWLVWSAQMDACERCWELHGERVPASEGFPENPPLHGHCKCVLLVE